MILPGIVVGSSALVVVTWIGALAVLLVAAADGFIFTDQVFGGGFISGSILIKLQINLKAKQRRLVVWQIKMQSTV